MRALYKYMFFALAVAQKQDPGFTEIFGTPPGLETESNPYRQQLLEIFGPLPTTKPDSDNIKKQIIEIFGTPPSIEPIDVLTLPPAVWLDIFGDDDYTESPENDDRNSTESPKSTKEPSTNAMLVKSTVPAISPTAESTEIVTRDPSIEAEIAKVFLHSAYENIEIKPTETSPTLVGHDGAPCKCVPYYLCDKDYNGVYINNASVTGYGELDIRFGEGEATRKCQETVELCCTEPKSPETVPQPTEKHKLRGCGYRNPKGVDFTITGGSGGEAEYGEFPWVVALIDVANDSLVGVGAIIHPQVIITGAHVASKYSPGTLRIRAGEWDTSTIKERLPFQEREIQEIYNHFDFHPKSLRNDLALLRLSEPLKLAEHINMICLPDQDESFDTSVGCIANGWGKDVFGLKGRYAVILKKVELNMVSYNRCISQLRNTRLGPNFILHSSFVCAGGEEGKDTCTGDGGAPLTCPLGNDRYKLTGLVAWGIGCGLKDVPAVYAGVSNFRTLVDDKMNEWGYGTTTYSI